MAQRAKKKSSRKAPPNRGASDQAYGEFVVVLEKVYSEIDALGEAQDLMKDQMNSRFDTLEAAVRQLDQRVTTLEIKVGELIDDMAFVKQEIRLIRHDLTQKVNREEFEMLESRVAKLEKELAVR